MTKHIAPRRFGLRAQCLGFVALSALCLHSARADSLDDKLTWQGITVYGTVDVGAIHETHGTPLNADYAQGVEEVISKNSANAVTALAPNGESQSKIGLRGVEPITSDLAGVFKLETGFSPLSFHLANSPLALEKNNGVAQDAQTSAGDSSRAGQLFQGGAYAGIQSKTFGTFTGGRQNSLQLDEISAYDPQGGSYAFSLVGNSSVAAGLGDSEDARLDNSIKYAYGDAKSLVRAAVLYKLNGAHTEARNDVQVDVGTTYGPASFDAVWGQVHSAVSLGNLSSSQLKLVPTNYLSATLSDNTAYSFLGKYKLGAATLYGAYEHIDYTNPSDAVATNTLTTTENGYEVIVANKSTTFAHTKTLQVFWAGAKYSVTQQLDLIGAYYHYQQNSYGATVCSNTTASTCSGALDGVSAVADYHWTANFDTYAGLMYYGVRNGLASGYLHNNTFNESIGARFNF
jgi:predicted porin